MDNTNLSELATQVSQESADIFIAKTSSNLSIESDIEEVVCDYSWVPVIEDCIPYLDEIIRNPRRFLVQEEDIVPVEKAKKITEETVKHLAQHTNLIQDVDEDGFIKPLKVLNVRKEDTLDLYENRFIYSLIVNLQIFLRNQISTNGGESFKKCNRKVTYNGETKLKNNNIKVSVSLESNFFDNLSDKDSKDGASIFDRIERINEIIMDFACSQFMKSMGQVTMVRSPIRKTNVILKDTNFQQALSLWEYIEKQQVTDPKQTKKDNVVEENEDIEKRFDLAYFLGFESLRLLEEHQNIEESAKNKDIFVRKVINDYVNNSEADLKSFKQLIIDQFKKAKKKKTALEKNIEKSFSSFIKNQDVKMKSAVSILEK